MYCCWCAGVISQQQKGQQKALHLSREVCQSERQTAVPRGPKAVGPRILPPLRPLFFFSTLLGLSFSLTLSTPFLPLSHSALFPFNQIQAKTRRAIYRRVVLFYQPVSICGTQMYRGLPGCWRQQCSAAANWRLCETERQKERHQMTMWDKRRIEQSWRMHDI